MTAYYNENDAYAAQWLRNLIAAGHVAAGDVDDRSIADVRAGDLAGYDQCHFFAGIGGWSYALRIAGWDDTRPVWTGSCPCQPFSAAGAGKAADDERHLWPVWFPLIAERGPPVVFGEQVEAAIGWGWLDAVLADLEGEGYACGATVLPACGVGAPHIRQRAWFVGHAIGDDLGRDGGRRPRKEAEGEGGRQVARGGRFDPGSSGAARGVADALPTGRPERRPIARDRSIAGSGGARGVADPAVTGWCAQQERPDGENGRPSPEPGRLRDASGLGHAESDEQRQSRLAETGVGRPGAAGGSSAWGDLDWLPCVDGKARPVEPGTFPLAHGIPKRVGRLRAYGNAIVPQVAAEFIGAFMSVRAAA